MKFPRVLFALKRCGPHSLLHLVDTCFTLNGKLPINHFFSLRKVLDTSCLCPMDRTELSDTRVVRLNYTLNCKS